MAEDFPCVVEERKNPGFGRWETKELEKLACEISNFKLSSARSIAALLRLRMREEREIKLVAVRSLWCETAEGWYPKSRSRNKL